MTSDNSIDETSLDDNSLEVTGLDQEKSALLVSQYNENDVIRTESFNSVKDVGTNTDKDLVLSPQLTCTKGKKSKKEKFYAAIEVAVNLIVEFLKLDKKITDKMIDTILASMFCGKVVTCQSTKGKKALARTTQRDRDFVRIAIDTSKKAKERGGGREEMAYAAASILACRSLRKYKECEFVESKINSMSDKISRETIEMMKREQGLREDDDDEISIELTPEGIEEVVDTIDYCLYEEPDLSEVSIVKTVGSFSSLDSALRERSMKVWNEDIVDYMYYGLSEAINMCGTNLLCASDDVKKKSRRSSLLKIKNF